MTRLYHILVRNLRAHHRIFYRFRPLLCIIFFYFSVASRVCCVAVNYVIEASATQRWSAQVIMRLRQQQLFSHNTCSTERERLVILLLTMVFFCLYYLHCTLPHKSITFRFFSIFLLLFLLTVYISIYKQPYDTRASRTTQQIGEEMRWESERERVRDDHLLCVIENGKRALMSGISFLLLGFFSASSSKPFSIKFYCKSILITFNWFLHFDGWLTEKSERATDRAKKYIKYDWITVYGNDTFGGGDAARARSHTQNENIECENDAKKGF